jgi:hypothetical protein
MSARKSGTATIKVAWPKKATADGWGLLQVVAIDERDIAHRMEVISVTIDMTVMQKK